MKPARKNNPRHIIRVITVLILLVAAGAGAVYSLQWWRQTRSVLRKGDFPVGIVIHHTATPPSAGGRSVDVSTIDAMHQKRGFGITDRDGKIYHIGYHFLIQQDGTVLKGRPEHLPGAHAKGHPDMLGIALVGDYESWTNHGQRGPLSPPRQQLAAAERLTRSLMAKYHLTTRDVYLHRELVMTLCPGDRFPREAFFRAIR